MRYYFILALSVFCFLNSFSREGMWLPYLIGQLNADEMTAMGMEISAEDIYNVNYSSLKDAIVHFGNGCTAELISGKGLLLTNHHCGYSRIQSHSSVVKDYLKNGFWAMNGREELKNPGLTAAIVKYMEDVTNQVLEGVTAGMDPVARESKVAENANALLESREGEYALEIKPFYYGNQYILIAKEVFKDVRLVGAPPSSIGKYGADTDNWVWPRHTGDFSLFRIYAGKDNKPAGISDDNVPYQPRQFLKVNIGGFEKNDFTMVYGFPGTTSEYLPSNEVRNIMEVYDPARIAVRDQLLEILDKKMRQSNETRIQYASKYASISNAWKKWIGEIKGLRETDAVAKKERLEDQFQRVVNGREEWRREYGNVLPELKKLYDNRKDLVFRRYMYIETQYYGNELVNYLLGYRKLVSLYRDAKEEELKAEAGRLAKGLEGFYKDYDVELDRKAARALLPDFLKSYSVNNPKEGLLAKLKTKDSGEVEEFVKDMYEDSPVLKDREEWREMLLNNPRKAVKKLLRSSSWQITEEGWNYFSEELNPQYKAFDVKIDELQRQYLDALQKIFPRQKFYPDANGTLRITYGKIQGYEPRDAVWYETQTYLSGVMAKYIPGDYEFDLPEKLMTLYKEKDYGPYGEEDKMPVCFIASNHTTGGNSGSPALNGRGELIGLNFDRTWEGTMSDYNYDISLCRNIMVDIRYVLFIVDKFAGAGYLVDEMYIVAAGSPSGEKQERREEVEKEIEEPVPAD